jgi:hypothetical protein
VSYCLNIVATTVTLGVSHTSLSEMKTYDVKNSYCPQPKGVNREREDFVNSIQFDGSLQNLIVYGQSVNFFAEVSI